MFGESTFSPLIQGLKIGTHENINNTTGAFLNNIWFEGSISQASSGINVNSPSSIGIIINGYRTNDDFIIQSNAYAGGAAIYTWPTSSGFPSFQFTTNLQSLKNDFSVVVFSNIINHNTFSENSFHCYMVID